MKISFSSKNAPLLILDEAGETVGWIRPKYSRRFGPPCPECGQHVQREDVVSGYGLQIKGRCWDKGVLRPKGRGGSVGVTRKRLKDIKALARYVLA